MLYFLYMLGFSIARALPTKVCYVLADQVAKLYFFFSRKDRKVLRRNFGVVLGEKFDDDLVDEHVLGVFRNFSRYLADFFKLSQLTPEEISKKVRIKNLGYIDECLKEGKGVIISTTHLGNWELGAAAMAALGYPMNAIILAHKDRRTDRMFVSQRRRWNVNGIPLIRKENGGKGPEKAVAGGQLKQAFRALRDNELLAIVSDRDYTGGGTEVEFFGKKAVMPKGSASLSIKTGAPIVVASTIRKKDDAIELIFEKPIKYSPTGDDESDTKELMARCNVLFEKNIRENLDQWYMFESIWDRENTIR